MLALMRIHREGASLTACPGFSGRGWGRVPGCRTGSNRAWALDTEPKLVWGVEDGSGHFFPFEGGMLQEERG